MLTVLGKSRTFLGEYAFGLAAVAEAARDHFQQQFPQWATSEIPRYLLQSEQSSYLRTTFGRFFLLLGDVTRWSHIDSLPFKPFRYTSSLVYNDALLGTSMIRIYTQPPYQYSAGEGDVDAPISFSA